MYSLIVCLALAAGDADYGWQRMAEGEMQYIIQIDPRKLDALRDGQAIESDVPATAGDVRSFRIVVGRNKLPHDNPPSAAQPASLTLDAAQPIAAHKATIAPKPLADKSPQKPPADKADSGTTEPPWLPLTFALLGLFASLGGNLFLGWVAWDARRLRRPS